MLKFINSQTIYYLKQNLNNKIVKNTINRIKYAFVIIYHHYYNHRKSQTVGPKHLLKKEKP